MVSVASNVSTYSVKSCCIPKVVNSVIFLAEKSAKSPRMLFDTTTYKNISTSDSRETPFQHQTPTQPACLNKHRIPAIYFGLLVSTKTKTLVWNELSSSTPQYYNRYNSTTRNKHRPAVLLFSTFHREFVGYIDPERLIQI